MNRKPITRWALLSALFVLLVPQFAAACPTCAAAQESSPVFWTILFGFILLPILVLGSVTAVLWKYLKIERPLELPEPPSPSSPRPPLKVISQ